MATKKRNTKNKDTLLNIQRVLAIILLCALIFICLLVAWGALRGSDKEDRRDADGRSSVRIERVEGGKSPKYSFSEELQERKDEIKQDIVHDDKKEKGDADKKTSAAEKGIYYVQIGAFSDYDYADRLRAQMILQDHTVRMKPSGNVYVVQLGPYKTREDAQKAQKELPNLGIKDSIIKQEAQ